MTCSIPVHSQHRRASALAAVMTTAALCLVPAARATAASETLPLGDADLVETRTNQALSEGVTLTRIVRGTEPASPDEFQTTTRGPWVVNVLTIDPRVARGHLEATYGPDLAPTEKVTELVRFSGALAGVNASFFTFTGNPQYPGDPVGLGVYGGELLSEPIAKRPNEVDLVADAYSNKVLIGHLSWSGSVQNRQTGAMLPLEFVNHPPVVPAGCADLADQTQCDLPGDVSLITPEFASTTPSGPGVEIIFDRFGCVVSTSPSRGTPLGANQTSLQATGHDSAALLGVAGHGCINRTVNLFDEDGEKIPLRAGLFGVVGRYRLTRDGQIVVAHCCGSHFLRHPRTMAGTTPNGKIIIATIDGRQPSSVGVTMDELADVAQSLDMSNAVSLDGGGSTSMSVNGELVSSPSGSAERAVGDALVYVDAPYTTPTAAR